MADEDVVDEQCAATAEADHDLEEVWPLEVLHGADHRIARSNWMSLGSPSTTTASNRSGEQIEQTAGARADPNARNRPSEAQRRYTSSR